MMQVNPMQVQQPARKIVFGCGSLLRYLFCLPRCCPGRAKSASRPIAAVRLSIRCRSARLLPVQPSRTGRLLAPEYSGHLRRCSRHRAGSRQGGLPGCQHRNRTRRPASASRSSCSCRSSPAHSARPILRRTTGRTRHRRRDLRYYGCHRRERCRHGHEG